MLGHPSLRAFFAFFSLPCPVLSSVAENSGVRRTLAARLANLIFPFEPATIFRPGCSQSLRNLFPLDIARRPAARGPPNSGRHLHAETRKTHPEADPAFRVKKFRPRPRQSLPADQRERALIPGRARGFFPTRQGPDSALCLSVHQIRVPNRASTTPWPSWMSSRARLNFRPSAPAPERSSRRCSIGSRRELNPRLLTARQVCGSIRASEPLGPGCPAPVFNDPPPNDPLQPISAIFHSSALGSAGSSPEPAPPLLSAKT